MIKDISSGILSGFLGITSFNRDSLTDNGETRYNTCLSSKQSLYLLYLYMVYLDLKSPKTCRKAYYYILFPVQEVTGQDLETRVMKDVMLVKVKRLKILSKDSQRPVIYISRM